MNDITRDIDLGGGRPIPDFYCPSEFWPALGYEGDARFVAVWWEPAGDEAAWSDGRQMTIGAEWGAYLALIDHNFPWPASPQLGGSEEQAAHWLIIDRHSEYDAWLVPASIADNILRGQWPAEERAAEPWSFDQLLAAIDSLPAFEPLSMEEIGRRMNESARLYEAFVAALKARPRGNTRCTG